MTSAQTVASQPKQPGHSPMPAKHARKLGINWERAGWIYMRVSGVLLVALIFFHLFVNVFSGEGVKQIDFAFVAGKLANPFWIAYDLALLWLALIHGANGMRVIINDYASTTRSANVMKSTLLVVVVLLLILGTLVLTTFDPCPAGTPADLLPKFCETL